MRFVPFDAVVSKLYVCLLYLSVVLAVYVVTTSLVFLFIYEPTIFNFFRSAKSLVRVFWLYHVYLSAARIQHLEKPHVCCSLKLILWPFF